MAGKQGAGGACGPPDRCQARCDGVIRVPARTAAGQRYAADAAPDSSGWAGWIALGAVCLGFFVIQLDVTIVNVALPTIQREVGGTVAGLQWILDAYTLALAAFMLTAGATADRLGARRLFLIGLAGFAVGSAGREHSGVASGVLNAARQSGGALGVALLGSLLASGTGGRLDLRVPLIVSAVTLVLAAGLAWVATRRES